jgi:hypothetical protein
LHGWAGLGSAWQERRTTLAWHVTFTRDSDRSRVVFIFAENAFPAGNAKGYAQREAFRLAPTDFRYAATCEHPAGERIRIPADGDDYEG